LEGHLQTADSEDPDERVLLAGREIEFADDRHREHDDGKVRQDVHATVEKPHCELIETGEWFAERPKCLDRFAREDAAEHGPGGVCRDDAHNDPTGKMKVSGDKDTSVLKEKRYFS